MAFKLFADTLVLFSWRTSLSSIIPNSW